MKLFARLLHEEHGQDMVEYGLLAAFISIMAVVTIRNIGPLIVPFYEAVRNALS